MLVWLDVLSTDIGSGVTNDGNGSFDGCVDGVGIESLLV